MSITKQGQEFIIKDTHRGLWYEDGKLTKVLEAGRYEIPPQRRWFQRLPTVECVVVDIRERDLTIKGQEILTADKVANLCDLSQNRSLSRYNRRLCESTPARLESAQ